MCLPSNGGVSAACYHESVEIQTTRLLTGFILYGALGVLAAVTLDDWRFRGGVLLLIAAMAFKTWLAGRIRN